MGFFKKIIIKILTWIGFVKKYKPKFETDTTIPANHDVVRYEYEIKSVSFSYQNPIPRSGGILHPIISVIVDRTPIKNGVTVEEERTTMTTAEYSRGFELVSSDGISLNSAGIVTASANDRGERVAIVKLLVMVGNDKKEVTTEVVQI